MQTPGLTLVAGTAAGLAEGPGCPASRANRKPGVIPPLSTFHSRTYGELTRNIETPQFTDRKPRLREVMEQRVEEPGLDPRQPGSPAHALHTPATRRIRTRRLCSTPAPSAEAGAERNMTVDCSGSPGPTRGGA